MLGLALPSLTYAAVQPEISGTVQRGDPCPFAAHAYTSFSNDPDGDGYGDPGHADCPGGEEAKCEDRDPAVHPDDDDCVCRHAGDRDPVAAVGVMWVLLVAAALRRFRL